MSTRPKLEAPSVRVIRNWLAIHEGCIAEIIDATGCGLSTVEKAIRLMRDVGAAELANLRSARLGRPRVFHSTRAQIAQRTAERKAAEAEALRRAVLATVQRALATRTPLEQAWSGAP